MDWVKLGVRYYTDTKIRELDDAAELMFVRGLARAGEVEHGGFIPESDVPLLTRRRRYGGLVDALVSSGLWTRVDGGYQSAAWSDWQDELDALTRRRKADRERKRATRAAAKRETSVHDEVSADMSADVRTTEGEEDLEKESLGRVGNGSAPPARAREAPPRTCSKHKDDPEPPPCFGCKNARLAYEAWETEQSKPPPKPPRCGECSETRHIELADGRQARCPRCHPQRSAS